MSEFYQGPCTAVVVRRHSDGKILASSRRYDDSQIGLPGGKVDEPGDGTLVGDPWGDMEFYWRQNREALLRGALREVLEETGIDLEPYSSEFRMVWAGSCENQTAPEGSPRFWPTWSFEVEYFGDEDPKPRPGEPLCRWATWEDICSDNQPFRNYNRTLYKHLFGEDLK